ncbi:MAG: trehalose-phosphatase [Pseudomonadota bacterium]
MQQGQSQKPAYAPPPLADLLTEGRVALFLDFDGTLVELASGPDAIAPLPDLGARLKAFAERLGGACALVSGRAISDIESHLGPLAIAAAGSHGSDIRSATRERIGAGPQGLPTAIETELRSFAELEALDYEHKPHGGALHYRKAPEQGPKAHAFAEALAAEHGWAAQSGKCVVELVAPDANKGSAVDRFMADPPFAGARPIFVGDDITDEAGFAACRAAGGAGILVGEKRESAAQYHLPDVASVHHWLEL